MAVQHEIELKRDFNGGVGCVRLVALLSPT